MCLPKRTLALGGCFLPCFGLKLWLRHPAKSSVMEEWWCYRREADVLQGERRHRGCRSRSRWKQRLVWYTVGVVEARDLAATNKQWMAQILPPAGEDILGFPHGLGSVSIRAVTNGHICEKSIQALSTRQLGILGTNPPCSSILFFMCSFY